MAIAFNSSSYLGIQGPIASFVGTYTVGAGANRLLTVTAFGESIDNLDGATKPTYAGVTMTLVKKSQAVADRWNYLWYLLDPASGSNTLVITSTNPAATIPAICADYTGVLALDSGAAATVAAGTTISGSVLVGVTNSWTVMSSRHSNGGATTAGGGTVLRSDPGGGFAYFDSNSPRPTGVSSLVQNAGASQSFGNVVASFSPFIATTVVSNLTILGAG